MKWFWLHYHFVKLSEMVYFTSLEMIGGRCCRNTCQDSIINCPPPFSSKLTAFSYAALYISQISLKSEFIFLFLFRNMDFTEYLSKDPEVQKRNPSASYDLIANIVQDGEPGPGKGTYRAHVLHKVCIHHRNMNWGQRVKWRGHGRSVKSTATELKL